MSTVTQQHIDQAADYIRRNGHVSFPELQRYAESALGMTASGDYSLEAGPNLLLWLGMSQEFVDLIHGIQATRQFDLNPTSLLVYMVDGGVMDLPLAKRPPRTGYKTPHWAPTVLHPKAASKASRR
ncbi:hypothetical protein [Pseudonocardia nigra]|uniref:hypothetical protein n=1 Tax=Pseudonocardia nigra TaxID=1921578 RepID=UPI001C5D2E2C|nr:hypothetical protein [Pseudonocardia nigra]